jgi:hypothetical protein
MAQDKARQQLRNQVGRLRDHGHHDQADGIERPMSSHSVERNFRFAPREACKTLLTAIEALDHVTPTMIEDFRIEVGIDMRLPDKQEQR